MYFVRVQAMVAYRDHCSPSSERFEVFPFTGLDGAEDFKDFLEDIQCSGGGDGPEDVAGGLQARQLLHFFLPARKSLLRCCR